jgi:hypothetical protein
MTKPTVAFAIFQKHLKITFSCEESKLSSPKAQQVVNICNVITSRQRQQEYKNKTEKRSSHPSEKKHVSSKPLFYIIHIVFDPDADIFFTWSQSEKGHSVHLVLVPPVMLAVASSKSHFIPELPAKTF